MYFQKALVLGLGRQSDMFEDFFRIEFSELLGDDSGHFWLKSNAGGLMWPQYPSMMLLQEINNIYFPWYLQPT